MIELISFLILVAIYFIPFLIALGRGIKNKVSVFFLNLFLGWTVVGYLVLLFYASLTDVKTNQSVSEFISKRKKSRNL